MTSEPADSPLQRMFDHREFIESVLPLLTGERCYVFGMLVYERFVVMAEGWYPFSELEDVVDALWARLPDGPSNPRVEEIVSQWTLSDSQPSATEATVAHDPRWLNEVRISDRDAAGRLPLMMFSRMTSALPEPLADLADIEWGAEREALIMLRGDEHLDIPKLRSEAREVGRQISDLLGMC